MNISDMLGALPKAQKREKEPPAILETVWGEQLDTNHVLEQYPRPQMIRNNYEILNGYWRYAITATKKYPDKFDGLILVPFSPESQLSGVGRQLMPDEYLWYERTIDIENFEAGTCCLLHFEAVDQCAVVYVNGRFAGKHVGGYLPFEIDLTPYLSPGKNQLRLTVRVQDFSDTSYHSRGKQKLAPSGMYYTAQSGIWQTVWMETVPRHHILFVDIAPDYDRHQVTITLHEKNKSHSPWVRVKVFDGVLFGNEHPLQTAPAASQTPIIDKQFGSLKITLDIPAPKSWTPKTPYLYPVEITSGQDTVRCYFAMRCFSIEKDDLGISRICLNHESIFLNGVLDQGYWPDGLYTAPSDDALIYDIQKMKQLGFNMLRKHAKIECRRWYYHCDRLGMIVWQDMVNGGSAYSPALLTYLPTLLCVPGPKKREAKGNSMLTRFLDRKMPGLAPDGKLEHIITGRTDSRGRQEFLRECAHTILLLRAFPSIMTWVPFNEGWGQFDTELITELIHTADPGRLVDSASGWFDHKTGDFKSVHNYFRKISAVRDSRAYVLSEYGGYVYRVRRHSTSNTAYGYHTFHSCEAFEKAFARLIRRDIAPLIRQGLCAAVYTQLSDIEEETNGLLTYDRRVCKISPKTAAMLRRSIDVYTNPGGTCL